MNILIAGSRSFNDYELMVRKCRIILSRLDSSKVVIVSGMARGADLLGAAFAMDNHYQLLRFPADWKTHGNKAGYLRNRQMLECIDAAIIFWDGQSKGTEDMIRLCREKKLPTRIIRFP